MVFAQIRNGVVANTIVLNDLSLAPLFSEGFDYLLRVDEMEMPPSRGWLYDGYNFTPPPEPEIEGQDNGSDT